MVEMLLLVLALLLCASPAWADPITAAGLLIAGTTIAWGTVAAVASLAYSTYSYLSNRRAQKALQDQLHTTGGGGFASSETYWSNIQTVWSAMGEIIPVVLGTHRVGPRAIQAFTRKEGSVDVFYFLGLVSHGEVEAIRLPEVNGESIDNFSGASWQYRLGTAGQTAIDWFRDINTQFTQTGKRIVSTAYTTYTVNLNCDKLRVRFNMPHGFALVYSATYDLDGYTIVGGYPYTHNQDTITIVGQGSFDAEAYVGGSMSPVQWEIELTGPFTAGQVLQFSKPGTWGGTGEHDAESYGNGGGPGTITYFDYIEIAHVVEVQFGAGAGFTYPNYALYGLRIPTTNQLSGSAPDSTVLCDGVKCTVPTYLPTPTFTRNPAWLWYECLRNTRWGAGNDIDAAQINLTKFKAAADKYDALVNNGEGGTEKRCQIDLVLDSTHELPDLADIFGNLTGSNFRDTVNDQIGITVDDPVATTDYFLAPANMNNPQWSFHPEETRFNSITYEFLDAANNYEKRTIQLPYSDSTVDLFPEMKVNLYGCTKLSQSIRTARYLLREARDRDVSFQCDTMMDAMPCEPRDKIAVGHRKQGQLLSEGNIVGYGNDYVVLPEPYLFAADYHIIVFLDDDTVKDLVVDNARMVGVTSEIVYCIVDFTALGHNPRENSPYTLGTGTNKYDEYLIESIERLSDKSMRVSAIKYVSTMWDGINDFNVADVQSLAVISGARTPAQVTNLTVSEQLTMSAGGEVQSNLIVAFSPPEDGGWNHARVYYNMVYDTQPVLGFNYIGDSTGQLIIPNVPVGVHLAVKVQSVSGTNLYASYDDAPSATIIPLGVNSIPIDVTGLTLLQVGEAVRLRWNASSDMATKTYEIRRGITWDGAVVLGTVANTISEFLDYSVTNDTYRYWIAGVNRSGTYSTNPTSATITVVGNPVGNVVFNVDEKPDWDGIKVGLQRFESSPGDWRLQTILPWSNYYTADMTWLDAFEDDTKPWTDMILLSTYQVVSYTTQPFDLGRVWSSYVKLDVNADYIITGGTFGDYWTDTEYAVDALDNELELMREVETPYPTTLQMAFSDDNVTWTPWAEYAYGAYQFRYVKSQLLAVIPNITMGLEVGNYRTLLDVEDIEIIIENLAVSSLGTTITFSDYITTAGYVADFLTIPKYISAPPLNTGENIMVDITDRTATGCKLVAYDATNTTVDAVVNVFIRGY